MTFSKRIKNLQKIAESKANKEESDLRDWFAGLALNGTMSKTSWTDSDKAAEYAYRFADAMMKARDNKTDKP